MVMFNEKKEEWSVKQGKNIPVWQSDKYLESRAKAVEIIESGKYGLRSSDFWILMNETRNGKMGYTGLIISHNGCLKINDHLADPFRAECVLWDKDGYNSSLVFSYCSPEQGIFEVGEVNAKNCKIDYPYAMAYKRMFDRVVLKLSKLAFAGIYSEVEADEFHERLDGDEEETTRQSNNDDLPFTMDEQPKDLNFRCALCGEVLKPYKDANGVEVSLRKHAAGCEKKFGQVLCLDCIKKRYPDGVKE